jgi:adenylate kinase
LGRQITCLIDAGDLVPDALVLTAVAERLKGLASPNHCLFDGVPRTVDQAVLLDELLASLGGAVDLAIELHASVEVLTQRMLHRAKLEGRPDDTPETLRHRLEVYASQAAPLLDYYRGQDVLHSFDAAPGVDEVFESIRGCVCDYCRST